MSAKKIWFVNADVFPAVASVWGRKATAGNRLRSQANGFGAVLIDFNLFGLK